MKKLIIILISVVMVVASCNKDRFEEFYPDPSKIANSTIEKQFTGMINSNVMWVVPDYWNYFVVLRITSNRWTQSVGWVNSGAQYIPGSAAINDRWNAYYNFLTQYRVLQEIYENAPEREQIDKRIYMIAAKIYFYHQTQWSVDLHGDIPWSEAGMMVATGGDYVQSRPGYDNAEDIYTQMLDDLKAFATELNNISVIPGILTGFRTQDIINNGDIELWRRYCNSLRLRMLTRVSGVPAFQQRASSEIAEILQNPATYPVIQENSQNVQIDIFSQDTPIHSRNFRTGLEDWNGNLAGKVMLDHLVTNEDPRLRVLFQPALVDGNFIDEWVGIDPLALETAQTALIETGTVSRYNWSTLSRNQYFPGVLLNAAEVDFIKAEYYLRAGNDAMAKASYESGIAKSTEFYYGLRAISNNNDSPEYEPFTIEEINNYLAQEHVSWDAASTTAEKLNLIGTQKWIHFNVVQSYDNWAEVRRLKYPQLNFWVDTSEDQSLPPYRWIYADSERIYNADNYASVQANDRLDVKLFWDVN